MIKVVHSLFLIENKLLFFLYYDMMLIHIVLLFVDRGSKVSKDTGHLMPVEKSFWCRLDTCFGSVINGFLREKQSYISSWS